jgi:bifunctional UDP-N-acetylglucosamine pyrophosphorylase/glucosamine-1-phosphate N-acetyltransferase
MAISPKTPLTDFQVVILAAGQGTRMKSALPKVLHPLAGKPLLAHVVDTARTLNAGQLCIVHGHGAEQVRQAVQGNDLKYVLQAEQKGTGHALLQALPALSKAAVTLVLYGDVPLIRCETLESLLGACGKGIAVLTADLLDPSGYGRILRNRSGKISGIVEDKDATAVQKRIREINTGILALPTSRLKVWLSQLSPRNRQGELYLTDVIAMAVRDKLPVTAVQAADVSEVEGINTRAQLAAMERAFQMRAARTLMDSGVTLSDPSRFDQRGVLTHGHDVSIDVNCLFEGKVHLGDNVSIGANCVLRDVTIAAGSRIEPFTLIDSAAVGEQCRIGPYARVRPGTVLDDDVHIGNFVEVKASRIGRSSKANHLAYVGDSEVGRDVNIGAGTITCNYDGASKHRTIIEDNVHIGSDVQLVAPVRIARDTTIGAGTTVWQDTAAGGLVLNPKSQQQRDSWRRPKKKSSPKNS